MDTDNNRTNHDRSNNAGGTGQNQNRSTGSYYYNTPPQQSYPRKKSTGAMIAGIVLILFGVSYIVDEFMPWALDWLDSGLIFACAAIVAGFALLIRR